MAINQDDVTTVEALEQKINKLSATITNLQNNPYAFHVIDAEDTSGFMNAAGFVSRREHLQALGLPRYLSDNTDILTLEAGFYKCYHPINLPDTKVKSNPWYIRVLKARDSEDSNSGFLILTATSGAEYYAKREKGKWIWQVIDEQVSFPSNGDIYKATNDGVSRSYYSYLMMQTHALIHFHFDVDVSINPKSYKVLYDGGLPGHTWLSWADSAKTENKMPVPGMAICDGLYEPAFAVFGPELYIFNSTDRTMTRFKAELYVEADKY